VLFLQVAKDQPNTMIRVERDVPFKLRATAIALNCYEGDADGGEEIESTVAHRGINDDRAVDADLAKVLCARFGGSRSRPCPRR
jgi:hypothetical protein